MTKQICKAQAGTDEDLSKDQGVYNLVPRWMYIILILCPTLYSC